MKCCCDGDVEAHELIERRHFFKLLASGALATSMIGQSKPSVAATDEIRIGYLPIADASLLLVAHANGFFADRGLNVAKPKLFRSWKQLVEAFTSGEINLAHMLNPIPVLLRFNNNFPIKIIGWGHVNGSAVLASKESGVTEFSQFGGMRIAIPSPFSVHNIIIQRQLKAAGLTPMVIDAKTPVPDKKTVGLSVLPPPGMVRALADGRIAGFTVAEPFNSMGESIAKGNILRFTGDVWKNHPCCVIVMNDNDVTGSPDTIQKITDGLVDAAFYATDDAERLAILLSREGAGYLPMPWTIIHKALTHYTDDIYTNAGAIKNIDWGVGRINFNPFPYHSATHKLISYMSETAVKNTEKFKMTWEAEKAARDLVDDRFIRKSLEERPDWATRLGADPAAPFERSEIIDL